MPTSRTDRLESLRTYYNLKQQGDPRANRMRDLVFEQNDRLAIAIARRMLAVCSEPLEDLKQIARIGLLKAIERFDPTKGAAFSSFAVPYIRGEILHFLRDHWSLLKIPRRWLEKLEQVERIEAKLLRQGRAIDRALIAASIGIDRATWETIESAFNCSVTPIDDVLHLSDASQENDRQELQDSAIARVALLPSPMRYCVVEHLFGKLKTDAIARQYSLDAQSVKHLIADGLNRLRSGHLGDMEA